MWEWLPFLFVAVMLADLTSVSAAVAGGVHSVGPIMFERAVLGGAALSGAVSKVRLLRALCKGPYGALLAAGEDDLGDELPALSRRSFVPRRKRQLLQRKGEQPPRASSWSAPR